MTDDSDYKKHLQNAADKVKASPIWKQGEVGESTPRLHLSKDALEYLQALELLVKAILRRETQLRNGSQTSAASILGLAYQMYHKFGMT